MIDYSEVIKLRMERQYLSQPVDNSGYDALFRDMSPVPTIYWCEPGSPPTLPLHTELEDYDYNSFRRSHREILKGRFAGGTIGYVTAEDLELFACLYRKEITRFTTVQQELLELFREEGPMNIGSLKELTGYLVKEISPALHRLQEAFLVYEDQVDKEWDRGWFLFEGEFPEVDLNRYTKQEALKLLIPRVAGLLVFFDEALLKSYYRLPGKLIKEALTELQAEDLIITATLSGKQGYLLKADEALIWQKEYKPSRERDNLKPGYPAATAPSVLMLQRNDFLLRAYAEELKKKFVSEYDTLYYLLIDGEFHGAVMGKFKFGPHVIEDIILDLPEEDRNVRKEEILEAVYTVFDPVASSPIRYNGIPMNT